MKNVKLNKKNELNKWDNKYLTSVKYRNGEEIKLAKNKEEWNQNNNIIYYEDSDGIIKDNRPKSTPEFTMEELIAKVGFEFKIKK